MMQSRKFAGPILPNHSEWIRLLRIDSYVTEEELQEDDNRGKAVPLSCTLQVFELKSLPEYTALSYTCSKPVPDDLPEPHDRSKSIPIAKALHSPANNWVQPEWQLKINQQQFCVARNLRDALIRLASSHMGCWIWIDAICIDQNDLDERSAQVQIMWIIYSNAETVRVWLGEEDETAVDTQLLQERLHPIILEKRKQAAWAETMDVYPSRDSDWACITAESVPMQWWWSWCHFHRRTWFERVWTMQEYVLAKKLDFVSGSLHLDHQAGIEIAKVVKASTWGHHLFMGLGQSMPLDHMRDPEMLRLETLRGMCVGSAFASSRGTALIQHVYGLTSTSTWLLIMLEISRRRFVSDPRDRIYGMAGMLTYVGGNPSLIADMGWLTIDYSSSMSWRRLSVLVAGKMILTLPFFNYLSLVRYRPIETIISEKLPSWAASLQARDTEIVDVFATGLVNRGATYDASGCENMERSFLHSHRDHPKGLLLVLRGLAVTKIDEILFEGPKMQDAIIEDVLPPILRHMAEKGPRYKAFKRSWELPEAIWRTLIADSTRQCPAEADMAAAFREWVLSLMLNTLVRLSTATEKDTLLSRLTQNLAYIEEIHQMYPMNIAACLPTRADIVDAHKLGSDQVRTLNWLDMFHKFTGSVAYPGRKLVTCTGGVLALVPREAIEGDILIIVAGARVPFAVRPHYVIPYSLDPARDPEDPVLQFVGEAYVHGIMHGEFCEYLATGGAEVPWRDFTFI